jgi:hypothetical protein
MLRTNSTGLLRAPAGGVFGTQAKEARKKSDLLMFVMAGLILFVLTFTVLAFWMGGDTTPMQHQLPHQNSLLMQARSYTNCSDFPGAVDTVRRVASGGGYLHMFEYEHLHPCCMSSWSAQMHSAGVAQIGVEDILFIVTTSSKTAHKAQAIKESWGSDLAESLFFVSDVADPLTGAYTFDEVSGKGEETNPLDKQHRSVVGLKHIYSNPALKRYRNKKWYFLVDDDTWLNIPALLNLMARFNADCPVILSYIWSGIWVEDFDYASGAAGFLVSRAAFEAIAPAFDKECAFAHYNEIAFSKCAWERQVQLLHHRGFYFDRPEMSKDRHSHVWYPPIGEAISYHDVDPKEMQLMSSYVNERWAWREGDLSLNYQPPGLAKNKRPTIPAFQAAAAPVAPVAPAVAAPAPATVVVPWQFEETEDKEAVKKLALHEQE